MGISPPCFPEAEPAAELWKCWVPGLSPRPGPALGARLPLPAGSALPSPASRGCSSSLLDRILDALISFSPSPFFPPSHPFFFPFLSFFPFLFFYYSLFRLSFPYLFLNFFFKVMPVVFLLSCQTLVRPPFGFARLMYISRKELFWVCGWVSSESAGEKEGGKKKTAAGGEKEGKKKKKREEKKAVSYAKMYSPDLDVFSRTAVNEYL